MSESNSTPGFISGPYEFTTIAAHGSHDSAGWPAAIYAHVENDEHDGFTFELADFREGDYESKEQALATARLFQAAPDLYAAVAAIEGDFPCGAVPNCYYRIPGCTINAMLAALALARGEVGR